MEKLVWTKDVFGSKLQILLGKESVGTIQWQNLFSGKAQALFNGKVFFLKRDFLSSRIEIYDGKDQSLLACTLVSVFNPRSNVIINGKQFELEIKNFWQSRWSWKFNGSEIITFTSNELITREKGDIELFSACNEEVEIMILLGLFVRTQFVLLMIILLVFVLLLLF